MAPGTQKCLGGRGRSGFEVTETRASLWGLRPSGVIGPGLVLRG
jgi:hypothetical protein